MAELSANKTDLAAKLWRGVTMQWLASAMLASVKTLGARQAKVLTRKMSAVFAQALAHEVRATKNLELRPDANPLVALNQYREAEVAARLCTPANVTITPLDDGDVQIEFSRCMYTPLCSNTLTHLIRQGDFDDSSVPCLRLETYSAMLSVLSNVHRPYRMAQFAPGATCQGILRTSQETNSLEDIPTTETTAKEAENNGKSEE